MRPEAEIREKYLNDLEMTIWIFISSAVVRIWEVSKFLNIYIYIMHLNTFTELRGLFWSRAEMETARPPVDYCSVLQRNDEEGGAERRRQSQDT